MVRREETDLNKLLQSSKTAIVMAGQAERTVGVWI